MKTTDAARVWQLESELMAERQKRLSAEQKLGGVTSLATRLKLALAASRAEAEKLKGKRSSTRSDISERLPRGPWQKT
jgi:hypothetical protein